MFKTLIAALCSLADEIRWLREQKHSEFEWLKSHSGLATKHDLKETEKRIMSKISELSVALKAFNDRLSAALNSIAESVTDLTGDIKTLNDKIIELQNSSGGVSPEDSVLIDKLQAQGEALTARGESISVALKAVADITPPAVPAVPE